MFCDSAPNIFIQQLRSDIKVKTVFGGLGDYKEHSVAHLCPSAALLTFEKALEQHSESLTCLLRITASAKGFKCK